LIRPSRTWIALCALATALAAETSTPEAGGDEETRPDPGFSEKIVVTAARGGQEMRNVPSSITTLDRAEVASSPVLTFDGLLQGYIPGFTLLRSGSSIASDAPVQAVHLRATGSGTSNHTLVLLDGVPIVDAFGGWIAWGRVPTEAIERVEVVRTGNATAWGNLAMGGVIHVITRKPAQREVSLFAEGGSLDTVRLSGRVAELAGPWGIELGGSVLETDGWIERAPQYRGPIDVTTRSRQKTARVRLSRALSAGADFEVAADWWDERRRDITRLGPGTSDALLVRASGQALDSREGLWRINLFGQETALSSERGDANPERTFETPGFDQFDVPATSYGGSVEWSRLLGRHQLTAGGDLSWVEGSTNEDFAWADGRYTVRRRAGGEQTQGGLYLADLWQLSPRWSAAGSLRFDRWKTSASRRTEKSLATGEGLLDLVYPDRSGDVLTSSLGVVSRPTAALGLRAALFTGFRAPNLNELHRPFRTASGFHVEANTALEPERSRGVELGFDVDARRGRLAVATYWNRVDDPIVIRTIGSAGALGSVIEPCGFLPAGGRCGQRENVGRLESRGAEVEGRLSLSNAVQVTATYVYIDSEIVSAPHRPALEGKPLISVPEHQATLRVIAQAPGGVELFAAGRYVGRRTDDDLGRVVLPSHTLLDLGASRPLGRGFVLTLAVENTLDREYEARADQAVELGAPRQVRLGLRYGWTER
jgi:outer membrane receptor protein involved in Fe transport